MSGLALFRQVEFSPSEHAGYSFPPGSHEPSELGLEDGAPSPEDRMQSSSRWTVAARGMAAAKSAQTAGCPIKPDLRCARMSPQKKSALTAGAGSSTTPASTRPGVLVSALGDCSRNGVNESDREERKHRVFFENAAEDIFLSIREGRYLSCNPALSYQLSPQRIRHPGGSVSVEIQFAREQIGIHEAQRSRFEMGVIKC